MTEIVMVIAVDLILDLTTAIIVAVIVDPIFLVGPSIGNA